jgi:hypothetical protein
MAKTAFIEKDAQTSLRNKFLLFTTAFGDTFEIQTAVILVALNKHVVLSTPLTPAI